MYHLSVIGSVGPPERYLESIDDEKILKKYEVLNG